MSANGVPDVVTELVVEWPMVLPSISNITEHHMVKHRRKKAHHAATDLVLRSNGVGWRLKRLADGERLRVGLIRVSPRKLDDDNLRGAFKAVRDQIARFFHIDDADPRIVFDYAQEKGKESLVRIEFEIEEATR